MPAREFPKNMVTFAVNFSGSAFPVIPGLSLGYENFLNEKFSLGIGLGYRF